MTSSNVEYDNQFMEVETLHWKPWVGGNYKLKVGNKLLVVGESHYCWKNEKDTPEKISEDINRKWFTRKIIHESGVCLNGKSKQPILRNIEKTLCNKKSLTHLKQKAIWHSVSFYNFIQRPLASREKKDRPNANDWIEGWYTFFKLVDILQPDYVLFCGVEALNQEVAFQNALKQSKYTCSKKITKTKNKIGRTFIRTKGLIENGLEPSISIACIDHPSSHFSWHKWHQVVKKQMPAHIAWLNAQIY